MNLNAEVYWTSQSVVFLAPSDPVRPNALEGTTESLISTAGVVATAVNQGRPTTLTSSASVNMLDIGDFDGWTVRLPNSGGQWATNFDQPLLEVEAAGATPDQVMDNLAEAMQRIRTELQSIQARAGVDARFGVILETSPRQANIVEVVGHRDRAGLTISTVGVTMTGALILSLEGRRRRMRELIHGGLDRGLINA